MCFRGMCGKNKQMYHNYQSNIELCQCQGFLRMFNKTQKQQGHFKGVCTER